MYIHALNTVVSIYISISIKNMDIKKVYESGIIWICIAFVAAVFT